MKYASGVVFSLIVQFVFVAAASAGKSIAFSMSKNWQTCSTDGIEDSQKFTNCITYPESGKNFDTCENPPEAIYFSRPGEKRFRDINGKNNKQEYLLSKVGQKMAKQFAKTFKSLPVKAVYTSHYTRTRQTACPLMRSKGLERHVVCKRETKSERFLLSALCKSHKDEVVVVIGHSDTLNEMLINLKVIHPLDNLDIELGKLYKVSFQNGKGQLEKPPFQYWKCGPTTDAPCSKNGAMKAKLN